MDKKIKKYIKDEEILKHLCNKISAYKETMKCTMTDDENKDYVDFDCDFSVEYKYGKESVSAYFIPSGNHGFEIEFNDEDNSNEYTEELNKNKYILLDYICKYLDERYHFMY